jgi:hypothetical protein
MKIGKIPVPVRMAKATIPHFSADCVGNGKVKSTHKR